MHRLQRWCILWGILLTLGLPRAHSQLFWNQAASFSGTAASHIAVPHSASLNITGSFTIECWVKPTAVDGLYQLVSKGIASSLNGYDLLIDSGRVRIRTNGVTRFISTAAARAATGTWTHFACTYNSSTGLFSAYINGASAGTATVVGAAPTANTDSLFIAKGLNSSYSGQIDDLRMWNRDLTAAEIARNRRSALSVPAGGVYAGLVLSMPFQTTFGSLAPFNVLDHSGNGNNGVSRGVGALDLRNRQFVYDTYNEALQVGTAQGYLSAPSNVAISLTGSFTLESWVYPLVTSVSGDNIILAKASGLSAPGRYLFGLRDGRLLVETQSGIRIGRTVLPAGYWSHLAATYNTVSDSLVFYVNGNVDTAFVAPNYEPAGNTDSLYIGEFGSSTCCGFEGLIDEVRIADYARSQAQIRSYMYRSIDALNQPNAGSRNVTYNLDGGTYDNVADGGPPLVFNGDAIFSNPARISNVRVSPMLRADVQNFPTGYYMKNSDRRIPESGTTGLMRNDTLTINQNIVMNDVNFLLLSNHTFDSDMNVVLVAPNGDSVAVVTQPLFNDQDDNIIAIFDDNADSSLSAPNVMSIYTSPAPRIKPHNAMNSVFSGDNAQGNWILKINDDASGDTGRVYAWGIQINNQVSVTGVEEVLAAVPGEYTLEQNFPNPFNPTTTIQFAVPQLSATKLVIYDLLGREVATLVDEVKPTGTYKATFDASQFASGAYFYRLQAGTFVETKRMMLIR